MKKLHYVWGYHSVIAALTAMPQEVRRIWIQTSRRDRRSIQLIDLAEQHQIPWDHLPREKLDELSEYARHQGVIAQVSYSGEYSEDYLRVLLERHDSGLMLLILDGVQDPHNLGACLRTANAAGVHAVIVPKDQACHLTPVVCKVASGAVGITPLIYVTNLARTLKFLKQAGVWVYGACEEADTPLNQLKLQPPIAWVFGAEGSGLRRLTKDSCDQLFKIPMRGTVADLNVSVAVGVTLFTANLTLPS